MYSILWISLHIVYLFYVKQRLPPSQQEQTHENIRESNKAQCCLASIREDGTKVIFIGFACHILVVNPRRELHRTWIHNWQLLGPKHAAILLISFCSQSMLSTDGQKLSDEKIRTKQDKKNCKLFSFLSMLKMQLMSWKGAFLSDV